MDFTDWAITLLLIHLLGLAVAARYEDNDDRRRTRHRSTTKPSDPPDQGTPPVTKTLLVATAAAVALVYAGAAFFDRMQADAYQSAALRCASSSRRPPAKPRPNPNRSKPMDVIPTPIPTNSHLCPRRAEGGIAYTDHDTWRDNGTCSYCGSYNPDALMAELEAGEVTLGPTDKSYKAYLTYDQADRRGKVYFQHFSEAQMIRFVELYNAKTLKIGYPNHFYVLPFFMKREPA